MKPTKIRWLTPELIFLMILVSVGLVYHYHRIVFFKPVGIHLWRNCVSAAFPVNYYYGGNFFTPQTNALLADNFTSDVSVVEFPLIYYIISLFYRVFGLNLFWHRMFHVFVGFAGLLYLFKASQYFTKSWFYAGIVPLIVFSSPIYAFYLNNFIPDAAALSLTFPGFYFFMKSSKENRFRPWLISMGFFALAGLTKTPSLLPFLGLGGVAIIELIPRFKGEKQSACFRFHYKYIGSYLLVLALISGWYLYAWIYSDTHGGSVSPVAVRPIWLLDKQSIHDTLFAMKGWFKPGYYHSKYFLVFTLFVFLGTVIWMKKADRFLARWNILLFLGAVSFTVLFFSDMRNHDYYQINNLFLLVTVYLSFFSILSNALPALYHSAWTKAISGVVVVLLLIHCNGRMHYRNSERDWYFVESGKVIEMYDIEEYLDEIGVDRSSKVYCTPDRSINISLFYCNRKGLTDYSAYSVLSLEERLEKMKEHQIEYVILGDRETYMDVEDLDQLLGEKIGQTGETEIFRLVAN